MLLEIDVQELRILRRALNHWHARVTHQQNGVSPLQTIQREHERTNRARHLAWGPDDVVFGPDDRT